MTKFKSPIKNILWFSAGLIFISAATINLNYNDEHYFEITKNIRIMTSIYDKLNTYYVDEPQPGQLMKTGIDAMLKSLDPYTVYYPESDIEDYQFMTTGQYGGIGAMIKTQGEYVVISDPYEDSPALKAGLMAGDKLLEVDGKSVIGKKTKDMSAILKGGAGTTLKVKYDRNGETRETVITRELIKIPAVPYFGELDNHTGYIKLNSFTSSASSEVGSAFRVLRDSNHVEKIILDLRGNGGGLLMEAVNIVNNFVPKGQEVVFTKGRIEDMNHSYKTKNSPYDTQIPVVVLINDMSASASEIVSGSLQDLDRAVIIGETSYGKGLVQQTKDIGFGSKVKLTVAKYYTPSGRCIQKLDYSHRDDDGKVHEVADSLLKTFTTKNGRIVKDGRGIEPDVTVAQDNFSKLTAILVVKDYVFNFANQYRWKHDNITEAKSFHLTNEEYDEFVKYVLENKSDIDYKTDSEAALEKLKKVAEQEKYFKDAENEYDDLLEKLKPSLSKDLNRYKDEIAEILEAEIVSRYYHLKGKIIYSLNNDPYLDSSYNVLNNSEKYNSILSGSK